MPKKKWNKEKLEKIAKKYSSLKKFRLEQKGAYLFACKKGCVRKITHHMVREIKPRGFWNKENCLKEARKFSYRTDFMQNSGGAYNSALKNNWIDEVCRHMTSHADGYHHCVYVIFNKRKKYAYIGVTRQRFEKRVQQHKSKENSSKSKSISNLKDTEFKRLTDYEFLKSEVKKSETFWVNFYANKKFKILNDRKQLGRTGTSNRIYSDEIIFREAKKYKKRVDFKKNSPKIYDAAISQQLLQKASSHMRGIAKKNTWTRENCLSFANKCLSKKEFRENNGAYFAALRNGWLDEIYSLFNPVKNYGTKASKKTWLIADKIYKLWIDNNKCGNWSMNKMVGSRCDTMINKFKNGWIPSKDPEWKDWKKKNSYPQNKSFTVE